MSDTQQVYYRDSWDELKWEDMTQTQFIDVVKRLVELTGAEVFLHRYDKNVAIIKEHEWYEDPTPGYR